MAFLNLPYYDILINLNFYQDALKARREPLTQCNGTIDENSMFLDIVGGKQRNAFMVLGPKLVSTMGLVVRPLQQRPLLLNKMKKKCKSYDKGLLTKMR